MVFKFCVGTSEAAMIYKNALFFTNQLNCFQIINHRFSNILWN